MAITKAIDLINRAKTVLQDTTASGTRWPNTELQDWLNDAQKQIVLYRPDAKAVNEAFTPTINQTKQTIPAAGLKLIDVMRNLAGDKKAIRKIERAVLDDQISGWHNSTATINVEHFIYDSRDPKNFYLYPVPATGASIEIIYSTVPAAVSLSAFDGTDTATIGVDDTYASAILDWMLYRAYSKDADYASNANRAVAHYQAFGDALNVKLNMETVFSQRTNENDGSPERPRG